MRNFRQVFLCQTQNIVIISASQAFVSGNNDKSYFVFRYIFPLVKIYVFDFRRTMQNI